LRQQQEEQKRVAILQQQEEQKRQEALRQQIDLDRRRIEENCRREEARLAELKAGGAAAREQLVKFEIEAGCKALRPMIAAAIENLLPNPPVAPLPPPIATPPASATHPQVEKVNLPEQIHQAQIELRRLGCFEGKPDSKMNGATEKAVKAFWSHSRRPIIEINITDDFIVDLQRYPNEFCSPSKPSPPVASHPPSQRKNTAAATPAQPRQPVPQQTAPAPQQERARATAGTSGPTIGTGF